MSAQTLMTMMTAGELIVYAGVLYLFRKKQLQHSFPAMGQYLTLHMFAAFFTPLLLSGRLPLPPLLTDTIYFYLSWAVYITSAILLFFVCLEIYRSVFKVLPGLTKLGILAFRWTAVISVLVTLSTVSFSHFSILVIPEFAFGLMRAASVIELCLLAFVGLSMKALGLSVWDSSFGLALGLGVMATNDLMASLLMNRSTTNTSPIQFVYESSILCSLGIWVAYCSQPEPVRRPVVLPMKSVLYRWNEIANALGHIGTQVAVHQPVSSFFLTDVEKIVDAALERNLAASHTSDS